MKIHFTASLTGKKIFDENYRQIFSCLKKLQCSVRATEIFSKTREEIETKNLEERIAFIKFLNESIKWCDSLIAEVSYPSTSVGYEINQALKSEKPVLALYFERKGDCPSLLKGVSDLMKEEAITLFEYNFQSLESFLRDYLEFIKARSLDKRFTMLFSPKMFVSLKKAAKGKNISMAEYIRDLIAKDIGSTA